MANSSLKSLPCTSLHFGMHWIECLLGVLAMSHSLSSMPCHVPKESSLSIATRRFGISLTNFCLNVTLEPTLQPLDGHALRYAFAITDEGTRADIQAKGFWGTSHQRAFFDVKVFNTHAPSNKRLSIPSCYAHHEQIKTKFVFPCVPG